MGFYSDNESDGYESIAEFAKQKKLSTSDKVKIAAGATGTVLGAAGLVVGGKKLLNRKTVTKVTTAAEHSKSAAQAALDSQKRAGEVAKKASQATKSKPGSGLINSGKGVAPTGDRPAYSKGSRLAAMPSRQDISANSYSKPKPFSGGSISGTDAQNNASKLTGKYRSRLGGKLVQVSSEAETQKFAELTKKRAGNLASRVSGRTGSKIKTKLANVADNKNLNELIAPRKSRFRKRVMLPSNGYGGRKFPSFVDNSDYSAYTETIANFAHS